MSISNASNESYDEKVIREIIFHNSISPALALQELQNLGFNVEDWNNSHQNAILKSLEETLHGDMLELGTDLRRRLSNFLKILITDIENHGEEVLDGLYELLAELQFARQCTYYQPEVSIEEDTNIMYYAIPLSNGNNLEIKQNIWHNEVGMKPWAAAYLLTEWLVENKEWVDGKRVLEVGAGVGLTGLMVGAALKPQKLCLTDYVSEVVNNLNSNVKLNQQNGNISSDASIKVGTLDWCNPELSGIHWSEWDLIIGADIVYNRESIPPLCEAIHSMLLKGSEVLVCMKIRSPQVYKLFLESLQDALIHYDFLDHPAERTFEYEERAEELKLMKMSLSSPSECNKPAIACQPSNDGKED